MRNPIVYMKQFIWDENGDRLFKKRDPYSDLKQDIIDYAARRDPNIRIWRAVEHRDVLAWKKKMMRQGHDGIILRDTDMNSTVEHLESYGEPFHDFFIPFSTRQIYSAHTGKVLGKADDGEAISR